MLGVPVLLVIAYWVIGCSFVIDLTLDNMGAALSDVFTDGFALLAMPLFILTGDLINKSGIARRLSDFAYSCLGWVRGGSGHGEPRRLRPVRRHLRLELRDDGDDRLNAASRDGQRVAMTSVSRRPPPPRAARSGSSFRPRSFSSSTAF